MAASALATVERLVSPIGQQARQLRIISTDDYEYACTFLQLIATRKKQVAEAFDPVVEAAHDAHKKSVAQRAKYMNPLLEAEKDVKAKVGLYHSEQERQRRAQERELQQAAAAQAQADAAAQAEQLEAAGESDLAEIVTQEAAVAPAPLVVLPSPVPKVKGIAQKQNWKWRVVDASLVPREFLSINEAAIGAVVRTQKELAKIPGIEVYAEDTVAVTAK
jgi:hypothetical protein